MGFCCWQGFKIDEEGECEFMMILFMTIFLELANF